MSRYVMIRRLRGPAVLMLLGVVALLHQLGVIDHFLSFFVPLLLILFGVLLLAERAALAVDGGNPPGSYPGSYPSSYPGGQPYPGAPYAGTADPNAGSGAAQYQAQEETAIVPAPMHDLMKDPEGGQS
jgi:hypothetical protein